MDCEEEEAPPAYTSTPMTPTHLNTANNDGGDVGGGGEDDDDHAKVKVKGSKHSNADGLTNCLTTMVKLVRSMGGLIIALLAYTFFGAWIMMTIEGPEEDAQKQEVFSIRESIAEQLKNNTDDLRAGRLSDMEWENRTSILLQLLETTVHSTGVASTSSRKWTFFGAVLFCVTTYTTIGYGNIAPATKAGRVATMLYATIGIPLALIVLADLGRRFTVGLKFVWGFIRRYYYTGYCRKAREQAPDRGSYDMNEANVGMDGTDDLDSGDLMQRGRYTRTDQDTPTLYRVDRENASGDHGKSSEKLLAATAEAKLKAQEAGEKSSPAATPQKDLLDGVRRSQSVERGGSMTNSKTSSMQDCRVHARQSESPPKRDCVFIDQAELSEDFNLPVLVAVGFIFSYIFLGAGMYTLWEEWTYLESFYFVFITTSTIGFGDVLPQHPNFFLLSCIYTFLGLALVSMTINVIVEWMAKTIDRAKEKVDQAKEKAVAKAKAAKGKLSEVGTRARNKVLSTVNREGSASPQLRDSRGDVTESGDNTHVDKEGAPDEGQTVRKSPTSQGMVDKASSQTNAVAGDKHEDTERRRSQATTASSPQLSDVRRDGGDLLTPSSDNEASFRTATDMAASSDTISEPSERK